MDVGEYRTGFETVSNKPSSAGAMLHARRPGAGLTLCGETVTPDWFAWAGSRFVDANGSACRGCLSVLIPKEVRA